jgi:predicted dehydrogenase
VTEERAKHPASRCGLSEQSAGDLRVGLIGHGRIGRHVDGGLQKGRVPGATLAAIVRRRPEVRAGLRANRNCAVVETIAEACGHSVIS